VVYSFEIGVNLAGTIVKTNLFTVTLSRRRNGEMMAEIPAWNSGTVDLLRTLL
jgi:hypothetical protein